MSFSSLGLSPSLCTSLDKLGYKTPTPVQLQAIPLVLAGRDLVARAQTGTGKTAAFALPIIDRLLVLNRRMPAPRKPRSLVLVPTRELAVQVHRAMMTYGAPVNIKAAAIYGGVAMRPQHQALQRGSDVVVATPGRLIDHLQQRTVDLSAVELLVLDEADRMLDMGFLPPLRQILARLPRERQTLLLSATLSSEIIRLASDFTRDPARVDVSETQAVAPSVAHHVHPVAEGRKGELLRYVLKQTPDDQALVFCKTKRGSNRVGEALERAGVRAAVIHGNKSQNARSRALGDFKSGRVTVLVATDLAARGLDIVGLPRVINYDLPLVAEDYIHRVGRTGRAGRSGHAVSLVSSAERGLLRDIERLLPAPLHHVSVEGFEVPAGGAAQQAPAPRHDRARRPGPGTYAHRSAGRASGPRQRRNSDDARGPHGGGHGSRNQNRGPRRAN